MLIEFFAIGSSGLALVALVAMVAWRRDMAIVEQQRTDTPRR